MGIMVVDQEEARRVRRRRSCDTALVEIRLNRNRDRAHFARQYTVRNAPSRAKSRGRGRCGPATEQDTVRSGAVS